MEIQQHDGMVVEATVISAGLRQAPTRERERCYMGRGRHQRLGAAALPPPTIYRASMESSSNEGEESASTYPCRSRAEAFKRTGLMESYSS